MAGFFNLIADTVRQKMEEGSLIKTGDAEKDAKPKKKAAATAAAATDKDGKEKPEDSKLTKEEKEKAEKERLEKEAEKEKEEEEALESETAPESEVATRLSSLCLNDKWADIYFLVGKEKPERIPAHKVILASRSEVFAAMFFGQFSEATQTQIEVDDLEPAEFKVMLRAMYTDEITFPETVGAAAAASGDASGTTAAQAEADDQTLMPVLFAAKKYGMERLRRKCVLKMGKGINPGNALDIFENLPNLLDEEKVCLQTIEDHAEEIIATPGFLRLSKPKLLTLVKSESLAATETHLWKRVLEWSHAEWKRMVKAAADKEKAGGKASAAAAAAAATTTTPTTTTTTTSTTSTSGSGDAKAAAAAAANPMPADIKEFTPEVRKYLLHDILPHIRFPLFPIQDLAASVAPLKLLSNDHMLKLFQYCGSGDAVRAMMISSGGMPFICNDRSATRAPAMSRMKFLIVGGDGAGNCNDVRSHIVEAYKKHYAKGTDKEPPAGMFEMTDYNQISGNITTLKQKIMDADAVLVWASQGLPGGTTEAFAEYNEAGGGYVMGYMNSYQTCEPPAYAVMTRTGHTQSANRTLRLPGQDGNASVDAKLAKHPVFRHVKSFDGGNAGSYGCLGTVNSGATLLAPWSDGVPLLAERIGQAKGKKYCNMAFNVYFPSARTGTASYWNPATDGGLIMLNCLIHIATKGSFKRKLNK